MKKFLYLGFIIVSVCLIMGCKSRTTVAGSISDLSGEWNIIEMNGNSLNPAETNQFLNFDVAQQSISGNAGCNRISGKIEYNEAQRNIIKFPRIVSTRMACMDMSKENELLKTLDEIVRFETIGNTRPIRSIAFYGTDNSKLLVLEKR